MHNYKRILSFVLAICMITTCFTGCKKKEVEEQNIFTELKSVSDMNNFDFEINSRIRAKTTKNIKLNESTTELSIETDDKDKENNTDTKNDTKPVDTTEPNDVTESIENVEPAKPAPASETNAEAVNETEETENIEDTETDKINKTDEITETIETTTPEETVPIEPEQEQEKKEIVTTETNYNLRLIGTYLGNKSWNTKIFVKDVDAKGYTNLTNIVKDNDDIYIDIYSLIDSIDFFANADGAIRSQFDLKNGNNFIKTNSKELKLVMQTFGTEDSLKVNVLFDTILKNIATATSHITHNTIMVNTVYNCLQDIINETTKTIRDSHIVTEENDEKETEETEEKETTEETEIALNTDDSKDDIDFMYTKTENDGTYRFALPKDKKLAIEYLTTLGKNINGQLDGKIKDEIAKLEADENRELKKKEERPDHTEEKNAINQYFEYKENWIKNLATKFLKYDGISNVDSNTSFKVNGSKGNRKVTFKFWSEKERPSEFDITRSDYNSISISGKLTEVSDKKIEIPKNIIKDENITLKSFYDNIKTTTATYIAGDLEIDESELTPERIIMIGKLIKPSQNEDFKYKIFDRYIEISQYIGNNASVTIPDTIDGLPVYVVDKEAFKESNVTDVTISNNIIKLGKETFYNCKELTSLTLSENLTEIPNSMCNGCEVLTSCTIPNSVKTIGDSAFSGCHAITRVVIPPTVNFIGTSAFTDTENLKEIVIMDGTIYDEEGTYVRTTGLIINTSAFGNTHAKTIIVPQTAITIEDSAFEPAYGCEPTFYGYVPSRLSNYCAKNKYIFKEIQLGDDMDKEIKGTYKNALNNKATTPESEIIVETEPEIIPEITETP